MEGKYYWEIEKDEKDKINEDKQYIFNKAETIYALVDRRRKIRKQIKYLDVMMRDMSGEVTINGKNYEGRNLNTVLIDESLSKLITEIIHIILNAELQFVENEIERCLIGNIS